MFSIIRREAFHTVIRPENPVRYSVAESKNAISRAILELRNLPYKGADTNSRLAQRYLEAYDCQLNPKEIWKHALWEIIACVIKSSLVALFLNATLGPALAFVPTILLTVRLGKEVWRDAERQTIKDLSFSEQNDRIASLRLLQHVNKLRRLENPKAWIDKEGNDTWREWLLFPTYSEQIKTLRNNQTIHLPINPLTWWKIEHSWLL